MKREYMRILSMNQIVAMANPYVTSSRIYDRNGAMRLWDIYHRILRDIRIEMRG